MSEALSNTKAGGAVGMMTDGNSVFEARTIMPIDKTMRELGYRPRSFREGIAIVEGQVVKVLTD